MLGIEPRFVGYQPVMSVAYRGSGFGVFNPPGNSEYIGGVLDRTSKKNQRLDFLL